MINPKDIYKATDGKIYSFSGFGGFMNCTRGMSAAVERKESELDLKGPKWVQL